MRMHYGPWVPYFAWRPVWARHHGWTWLRSMWRRRQWFDPSVDPIFIAAADLWEYCRTGPDSTTDGEAR